MQAWPILLFCGAWMTVLALTGRVVARALPGRLQPFARLFLSPALGLAVFLLLATLSGWVAGTRGAWAIPVTLAIAGFSAWMERKRAGTLRHAALAIAVMIAVSFGVLLPLWEVGGYNVFNDTFTYLVHGQWLQTHDFRTYAAPTVYQPAFTQVALYQALGFRMGASFFLGWLQAVSPFAWSIQVYPAAAVLALACGSWAIGGVVYALAGRRWLSLVWGVVAGSGIGGFAFGSFMGFLPQLFGLALATAFLALLVRFRPAAGRWTGSAATVLPLALLFAAVGFAYSELLPLVTLSAGGWFAVLLVTERSRPGPVLRAGVCFLLLAALLLNLECLRILRALSVQKGAVVGWAVPWSLTDFAAHAAGFRTGSGDGDRWLLPPNDALVLLAALAAAAAAGLVRSLIRSRARARRWAAPLVYLGICIAGLLYFRLAVPAPWPKGVGQTWNQFKLSNWASPILLASLGAGLLGWARGRALWLWGLAGLLLVLNFRVQFLQAPGRVMETQRLAGRETDPFKTYFDIRAEAKRRADDGPVFLSLGGREHKSRQLAAYFLNDMKVTADWTGDGYIYPFLPPGWQSLQVTDARWWIRRIEGAAEPPAAGQFRSGSLLFEPTPDFMVSREEVTGGHGVESDATGWWSWTPARLTVRFKIQTAATKPVRVNFTCLPAVQPREVELVCRARGRVIHQETIPLVEGWQGVSSGTFSPDGPEMEVELSSKGAPVPISATDSRPVAFLAKNVRVELAVQ